MHQMSYSVVYQTMVRVPIRVHQPMFTGKKKQVKQSRNGPGVAQRVPGGLGSQIFMTFGT
jgi:hypothetical protein